MHPAYNKILGYIRNTTDVYKAIHNMTFVLPTGAPPEMSKLFHQLKRSVHVTTASPLPTFVTDENFRLEDGER